MNIKSTVNSSKLSSKVLLIIGMIFLVIGVCISIYDSKVKSKWEESIAIITNINHFDEMIKISYNYKGVEYNSVPSYYSSFYGLGDELIIYINPINPDDYYIADTLNIGLIFGGVGGVFLVVFLILLAFNKNRDKVISDCLNYGYKKTLEVKEVKRSHTYKNGIVYYYLMVMIEGKSYKSDLFTINGKKSDE